mgnify:CR=1 FL=1|tara:strand:- start:1040 stop:1183 length:144 start_codon:yes stop_codon:yes gene_type:complete
MTTSLSKAKKMAYESRKKLFDDDLLSVEQAIALEDAMRDMYDINEDY